MFTVFPSSAFASENVPVPVATVKLSPFIISEKLAPVVTSVALFVPSYILFSAVIPVIAVIFFLPIVKVEVST